MNNNQLTDLEVTKARPDLTNQAFTPERSTAFGTAPSQMLVTVLSDQSSIKFLYSVHLSIKFYNQTVDSSHYNTYRDWDNLQPFVHTAFLVLTILENGTQK